MNSRDPRVDPKAGDVTRSTIDGISFGARFTVLENDGISVRYMDGESYESIPLDEWRLWSQDDEVLYAAD